MLFFNLFEDSAQIFVSRVVFLEFFNFFLHSFCKSDSLIHQSGILWIKIMWIKKVVLLKRLQIILNRDPWVLIKVIINLAVLPNGFIILTQLVRPILPLLLLASPFDFDSDSFFLDSSLDVSLVFGWNVCEFCDLTDLAGRIAKTKNGESKARVYLGSGHRLWQHVFDWAHLSDLLRRAHFTKTLTSTWHHTEFLIKRCLQLCFSLLLIIVSHVWVFHHRWGFTIADGASLAITILEWLQVALWLTYILFLSRTYRQINHRVLRCRLLLFHWSYLF